MLFFLIPEALPSLQKYLEGYALMASESNRHYWIFTSNEVEKALEKVGLQQLPESYEKYANPDY